MKQFEFAEIPRLRGIFYVQNEQNKSNSLLLLPKRRWSEAEIRLRLSLATLPPTGTRTELGKNVPYFSFV